MESYILRRPPYRIGTVYNFQSRDGSWIWTYYDCNNNHDICDSREHAMQCVLRCKGPYPINELYAWEPENWLARLWKNVLCRIQLIRLKIEFSKYRCAQEVNKG